MTTLTPTFSRALWRDMVLFALALASVSIPLWGQAPNAVPPRPGGAGPRPPERPIQAVGITAPSHVYVRGDVEILTFESEQDYDRLQELYQASAAVQPEPGQMTTLYLRSRTDGSVQPYSISLPRDFSRDRKYPLVIQLHGLNFHEVLAGARGRYRGMGGPQWVEPDLPVIYVDCFGGPSAFYRGIGEEGVLETLEEVEKRFPIDPDRVFLMGHSMGGCGSYEIGLHHPDLFGGIMPLDAAMGPHVGPEPTVPAWMHPQVAMNIPASLYANARNVDVFVKNAGAGIQQNSTEYADGSVAEGGFSTAESFPGMPHNFGDKYPYSNFVTELIAHPVQRHPSEVKFYTNTLRYNRAYWVTIDRLTQPSADTLVKAKAEAKTGVEVTTKNIDAFTLRLDQSPSAAPSAIVIDGKSIPPSKATFDPVVSFVKEPGGFWVQGVPHDGPLVEKAWVAGAHR